jgi:hypothetical protein
MRDVNELLWFGPEECSEQEERILKRAQKNRKLYVFLRQHRHEIFDEEFQRGLMCQHFSGQKIQVTFRVCS